MNAFLITLAAVAALTLIAIITIRAWQDMEEDTADHDRPENDDDTLTLSLERKLAFVLPSYVYLDLNRPFHKDAA